MPNNNPKGYNQYRRKPPPAIVGKCGICNRPSYDPHEVGEECGSLIIDEAPTRYLLGTTSTCTGTIEKLPQ